ncbi:MAG: hypothetical protein JNM60_03605 [Candidatus Competibacteraceae bacterium]|nr:hypothetical protein [Candidatus Competibacteraceae bacterium]
MTVERSFSIAADHPSLAGHFPGNPIVPGAVILDEVLQAFAAQYPDRNASGMPVVKFLAPLRPEQTCIVRFLGATAGKLRFECVREDGQMLAQGQLRWVEAKR